HLVAAAVFGMGGRAAMDVHDHAPGGARRPVEPALDVEPIGRGPDDGFGRRQGDPRRRREPGQAAGLAVLESYQIVELPRMVPAAEPSPAAQRRQGYQAALWRPHRLLAPTGGIEQAGLQAGAVDLEQDDRRAALRHEGALDRTAGI